ncbi:type II 3-dehydroquinate dehydratase [uncultured Microscilla sp.]|uniref:type II 3-dehydroquinate dehydratase n=1 Tax=uncultured Microscilla sp. TaxID=432653 RepID=UPI0026068264|nr:type II 3-dehydroquinate dehydratase [uncultured Microscilla sp.]
MTIAIINGPNLNLLGKREVDIYGNQTFDDYFSTLKEKFDQQAILTYFQSNHEGGIIDHIHEIGYEYDGIVLNGAAYTHTSVAIADAIAAVTTPVVEVHISNIHAREGFRQHSYSATNCIGVITGLGLKGYELAIKYLIDKQK